MCIKMNKVGKQEVGLWWAQKRFPRYGVPIWSLWFNIHLYMHIFLSNYWWQESDIWSQASYGYAILWEVFLDSSDSYFLPQVFRHKSRKTNLNSPVSTAHNYLLTTVYWSVIMECQNWSSCLKTCGGWR
jgi:hypothetical protein